MNSVTKAVSSVELSDQDKLLPWANKEAIPVFRQMRTALNAQYVGEATAATAGDAAWTTVWTSDPIPTNSVWLIEARGAGFGVGVYGAFIVHATYYNNAGTVGYVSIDAPFISESDASLDFRMTDSGGAILVQVKDNGSVAMNYSITVLITRVRQAGA